jgi:hypothetical protein
MKYFKACLLATIMLAGCTLNQYQDDIADNQYHQKQTHADANAPYVGEWTAATNIGIRSIKIKEDGRIKVCLAPSSGTNEGKVYMDNGMPAIIIKTGAKVKIISTSKDFLLLEVYGNQEKYHAGLVDDACVSAFSHFE